MAGIEKDYFNILEGLKEKIRIARQRAVLTVNRELLAVYWEIGHTILKQQATEGWGTKVIDRLAADLKTEFPDFKGLSARNLQYMKSFAEAWPDFSILQPLVAKLKTGENEQHTIAQPLVAQIPWAHHVVILNKVKSKKDQLFYVQKTAENGWSKSVLGLQIESQLHLRQGNAITNFETTLPKAHSDLAIETLKNPYVFDFLGIGEEMQERELEKALIQHIKKFMLELGRGFAYVGNQYNLNVEGDDYFLDLLFFNYHLDCFVVFELKVGEFKPEFAGKLNFYINTIDAQVKASQHKPTIGVLLCKTPNETVVKYALKGIDGPIGVAEYELTNALPKQLKADMPTIEELEQEVQKEIEALRKPIDEKKNRIKDILEKIKAEEVKKVKDKEALLYLFNEVIWKIKEKTESILTEEMKLFTHSYISRIINETADTYYTSADLEGDLNLKKQIRRLGLSTYFDGFKKAGTNAFGIHKELFFELEQYKYKVGERQDLIWQEYLYHHKWTEEELMAIAEKWSESILDEINRRLEQINTI